MQINSFFKKNKKVRIIAIVLMSFILLIIVLMQFNTNSVIQEVHDSFYCKDCYLPLSYKERFPDVYENDPNLIFIEDDMFYDNLKAHFNRFYEYNTDTDNYKVNVKVRRVYTIHKFKSGYLWMIYLVEVLDNSGKTITASINIPVKLKIKKNNSKWEVIDIDEKEAYSNIKDFLDFWTM